MPHRCIREVIRDKRCISVTVDTPVLDAARLMKSQRSSAVMVIDGRETLVGICTERDIVFEVVAGDRDPHTTLVDSVMTRYPQTITADKPLGHALHLMYEGGFRHVPVVDLAGRPIGIVAARDALNGDALEFEHDLERRQEITVIL